MASRRTTVNFVYRYFSAFEQIRCKSTLQRIHKIGLRDKKVKKSKNPLDGKPFAKGIVLKTTIKKPKKPNSANRKCVVVKLSTGREMTAYIPGKSITVFFIQRFSYYL